MGFFITMISVGNEMNTASGGALSLPRSNARVLDLCMAPGGYTAAVLKHSPHAVICAFTLPLNLGGHPILHRRDHRVDVRFGDVTMLHKEFGVTEIPHDHRELSKFSARRLWYGKFYDLIFCDGQALRTHQPYIADYRRQVEAVRLRVSQLILAMQRIEKGGTFIMLLHNIGSYKTMKILSIFDEIAQIELFKPVSSHKKRGSFYLIAKNVDPGHPEAVAAVSEWKKIWEELTFPKIEQDGLGETPEVANGHALAEEVSNLLESFGTRAIDLGEPIWQIQKDALSTAKWTKKKRETDGEQAHTAEASTAATGNAAVAVPDSEEDLDDIGDPDDVDTATTSNAAVTVHDWEGDLDDAEDPDNMDTTPVLMKLSYSADVSAAMENLDLDN